MRYVYVMVDGITEQPGGVVVTGEDDATGELVKFSVSLEEAARLRVVPGAYIPVADEDVISVEPVSGEWDSPGTSPEEYDDETF